MALSEDQTDYVEHIADRCRKLIHTGIWEGITQSRLDNWLGCLRNCDTELLGAYLLDNLTYRSREQFMSLLDTIFYDRVLVSQGRSVPLLSLFQSSRDLHKAQQQCLAPVIGLSSPPTKSGPYILRLAARRFKLKNDWLVWPQKIKSLEKLENVVFVDDFCGTGNQFSDFLNDIKFEETIKLNPTVQVTYLVATIHSQGIEHIQKKHPYVNIVWGERLKARSDILSTAAFERYRVSGFASLIQNQYDAAVQYTELPAKGKFSDGFGSLRLAYGFAHATPNNTLPIFWMATKNLTPLLDR
jgi:hypothetical protein